MNRFTFVFAAVLAVASLARADIRTSTIEYKDGDTVCEGYLAFDDAVTDVRPAVLVFPEWWGLTEYPKHRAEQLAKMGYVAFVADMYGSGKNTEDMSQANEWHAPFVADRKLMRARAMAGLNTLLGQKYVDKSRVAAIGYCFGGTCALELARAGAPLAGVVSFHGDLSRTTDEGPDSISAKILICHGAADELVTPRVVADCEAELVEAKANYQINIYSGAKHGFTNPAADSHHTKVMGYDEQADKRSWAAMKDFFEEIFK